MSNKFILALDQGSSASRVLAIDEQGRVIARASRALNTLRPSAGFAELDAAVLLQEQLSALEEVLKQIPAEQVVNLTVASQRSTVVFWDKQTGKPLGPALSWQDGRAQVPAKALQLGQEQIHQLTGLYATPFYSAAKIHWALQRLPQVAQAAKEKRLCVGPVASYLIWHLTGGKIFACDPTLAQRTLLFDIKKLDWAAQLLDAFGVAKEWLPEIKNTCDAYGFWAHNGLQIPIRVCVGDQQAALYALEIKEGGACINYGTGAFFMRHTGTDCHFFPGLLTSVAVTHGKQSKYLLEGPVNACSTVFAWLSALGIEIKQEELDTLCAAAKEPISLLPALGGLGAPYWDFKLSPVMAGFSPRTTKADVALGTVESLANLLADIVFYTAKCGISATQIKVAGGLSKSRALLQSQADILQLPLVPCAESESTALGAALLGAKVANIDTVQWKTLELLPSVKPQLPAEQAKSKYEKWQAFVSWCKAGK